MNTLDSQPEKDELTDLFDLSYLSAGLNGFFAYCALGFLLLLLAFANLDSGDPARLLLGVLRFPSFGLLAIVGPNESLDSVIAGALWFYALNAVLWGLGAPIVLYTVRKLSCRNRDQAGNQSSQLSRLDVIVAQCERFRGAGSCQACFQLHNTRLR